MMDKETLINGYFEGSLSENQLAELESLRTTDSAFAAAFEFEHELQSALKKEEREEIKSMFSKLNSETSITTESPSTETGTKVISMRPWLVAASIALLIGLVSWLLLFNNSDLNTAQLYAANYAPYENVVHPIERGNQMEGLKDQAFTAYEDGDYTLALKHFKELQLQHSDPYITFYEAIVLMQLNKHQEAVPLLEAYIENDGQLKDRATWYLALSYLKMDELGKSKTQLIKLVGLEGFKTKAAKELLQKID